MDIDKLNEECPTIFIMMSGRKISTAKRYIFKSNYSSHSNAAELESFMKAIHPKRVTYHSHAETKESRKYRAYLAKTYTEEGKEISMEAVQRMRQIGKHKRPIKEYKN